MKIDFLNVKFCERCLAKKVVKNVLKELDQPQDIVVSISVVSDEEMKELNSRTRKVDSVTDVLSFPAQNIVAGEKVDTKNAFVSGGAVFLGDVVVDRSQIERQAKEFGVTYRDELVRMVLHSMLHLLGYDHIEANDAEIMHAVELPLLEKLVK